MLSPEIDQLLSAGFDPTDRPRAIEVLENYRHDMERERLFRLAIKLSKRDLGELQQIIETANEDPRDILSADSPRKEINQTKTIIGLAIVAYFIFQLLS